MMKKRSLLRRAVTLAGSALLAGSLFLGLTPHTAAPLAVSASAKNYAVQEGDWARVDADHLNVRSGPGTQYVKRGQLAEDTVVKVLETYGDWVRIQEGWVAREYLRREKHVEQSEAEFTGVVNADALNVRRGPGTEYAIVGKVYDGYRVKILETKDGWGRTDSGWVKLSYINRPGSSGQGGIHADTNVQVNATHLNVRQGPGTNYARVDQLVDGERVTVLEVRNGWGRIREGWISLQYVVPLGGSSPNHSGFREGDRVEVTASALNLRRGPGTNYQTCGQLTRGFRTTLQGVEGKWGLIDGGWISLKYVKRAG